MAVRTDTDFLRAALAVLIKQPEILKVTPTQTLKDSHTGIKGNTHWQTVLLKVRLLK
jgi:hypothetical protein